MSAMAYQITGVSIVYSNVCPGVYQRKHQSSALLAFVKGIHRLPVNSQDKEPVTQKMFPFDDVIMQYHMPSDVVGCIIEYGEVNGNERFIWMISNALFLISSGPLNDSIVSNTCIQYKYFMAVPDFLSNQTSTWFMHEVLIWNFRKSTRQVTSH